MKTSPHTMWLSMVCAMIANVIWIYIAKKTLDPNTLVFYALCWDSLVVVASILTPIVMFANLPSMLSTIGIAMVLTGLVLVKVGT